MPTEAAYTVRDGEAVKETLNIDYTPVGLYVENTGDRDSCTVEVLPSNPSTRNGIAVSNKALQDLLESGAIELKEQ